MNVFFLSALVGIGLAAGCATQSHPARWRGCNHCVCEKYYVSGPSVRCQACGHMDLDHSSDHNFCGVVDPPVIRLRKNGIEALPPSLNARTNPPPEKKILVELSIGGTAEEIYERIGSPNQWGVVQRYRGSYLMNSLSNVPMKDGLESSPLNRRYYKICWAYLLPNETAFLQFTNGHLSEVFFGQLTRVRVMN